MKANGFIRVERDLWTSPEVTGLSVNAQVILVDMLYRHNGRNNGKISYSWADARCRLGCSFSTVARVFAELRAAGLIETTVKGSFDHKNGIRKGACNQYRLTCI